MSTNLRFLVVDDMQTIRKMIVQMLTAMKIESISEAANGTEALNALDKAAKENNPFHIIICDWHMPDIVGPDLVKKCRATAAYKNVGFLMLTSEADTINIVNAMVSGVDDYALKPITPEVLKNKINTLIKKKFNK